MLMQLPGAPVSECPAALRFTSLVVGTARPASQRASLVFLRRLIIGLLIATAGSLLAPAPAAALRGECGQPVTTGKVPRASDCLFILKNAVGAVDCLPACVCATKGRLPVRASDALICLKSAVGQPVTVDCPFDACPVEPGPIALASVSPAEGTIGTTITIRGSGFGFEDTLSLAGADDVALEVLDVRADRVLARLVSAASPGTYDVKVDGEISSSQFGNAFAVRLPADLAFEPEITGLEVPITISGSFLGSRTGVVSMHARADPDAEEIAAEVLSWSDDEVVFLMPSEFPTDGPIDVTVSNLVGSVTAEGLIYDGGPRVISAVATSNTEVLVQFSEPLLGGIESAENPSHYRISGQPTARTPTVGVLSAELTGPTSAAVRLTTVSQSDLLYTLVVTSIYDLNNNPIPAPTERVTPSITSFLGLPPSGAGIDSDGDGLTDADEQRGWYVRIFLGDDEVEVYHVTSDPGDPRLDVDSLANVEARDSDQDGVPDNEEKHALTDPRSPDTDGDTLTDGEEWNVIYSDPKNQDTDGDGTQDGFEFYAYRTSPILADTDGDQISDTEEVTGRNRDPRIADIPIAEISIGEVRLQIDERYTYEDSQGNTQVLETSSASNLSESTSRSTQTSTTKVLEAMLKLGAEFTIKTPPETKLSAGVELRGSYTFQTSRETAIASQEAYERSVGRANELDSSSTVVREIVGASIGVDVNLRNEGDIAFAISNVEITVQQRDRQSSDRLVPVATLIPQRTITSGDPVVYNLGPFFDERGPILFSSVDVYPNLVEQLMQAPSGLVFTVSNFDMTDEFGRVFSFANQIARDRTAGIVVDSGEGVAQRYLVSTALQPDPDGIVGRDDGFVGGFNPDGSPKGISLDFALRDILALTKTSANQCAWQSSGGTSREGCDGIVAGLNSTAETIAAGDDVQLIPRDTTGVSVGSIVIDAGRNGVLETVPGGDDTAEAITGYETSLTCSAQSPSPGDLCDENNDCGSGGSCTGPEVLVRFGSLRTGDFNRKWVVLTNGEIPAGADFGQVILEPGMDVFLAFVQDLDEDGLFAREEFLLGSTDSAGDRFPNRSFGRYFEDFVPAPGDADGLADSKDTDRDGLGDFAEVRIGWKVDAGGGVLRQVYSSPRLRDSDGDGLEDPVEKDLREFCNENIDRAMPTTCAFQQEQPVTKEEAVAIIAGLNGLAESAAAPGDATVVVQGSYCVRTDFSTNCYWNDERLAYGQVIISEGSQPGIQTNLSGDDLYVSASATPPPATDPAASDTDTDGIEDATELDGYSTGFGLRDGGNGYAETRAEGDDIQKTAIGAEMEPGGLVLLPGPNGRIDTAAKGDEVTPDIFYGRDREFQTVLAGDDTICCSGIFIVAGANGILDSVAEGDDFYRPSSLVGTDPLRLDSDDDLVTDGRELELGANPIDPSDGGDFVDSDRDGLTDAEETEIGWTTYVDRGFGTAVTRVYSNPNRPDSDFDGLPDYVERNILSNPNLADTDRDGLSDYDEFAAFEDYFGLSTLFAGFSLDGSGSAQYGTSPSQYDTDFDDLSDYFELVTGYTFLLPGGEMRHVFPDPLLTDTDLDGLTDYQEAYFVDTSGIQDVIISTDATDPDTDGDGTFDGAELANGQHPHVPDLKVEIAMRTLSGYIDKIDTNVTALGNAVTWWITVTGPNDVYPTLLTSARYADTRRLDEGVGFNKYRWEPDGSCWFYSMFPGSQYTLRHDFDNYPFLGRIGIVLREGESFALDGIIGEIDDVSDDCGRFPYYIPSYLADVQRCVGTFSETFTFDDFIDGGSNGAAAAAFTENDCSFEFAYSVEVK